MTKYLVIVGAFAVLFGMLVWTDGRLQTCRAEAKAAASAHEAAVAEGIAAVLEDRLAKLNLLTELSESRSSETLEALEQIAERARRERVVVREIPAERLPECGPGRNFVQEFNEWLRAD